MRRLPASSVCCFCGSAQERERREEAFSLRALKDGRRRKVVVVVCSEHSPPWPIIQRHPRRRSSVAPPPRIRKDDEERKKWGGERREKHRRHPSFVRLMTAFPLRRRLGHLIIIALGEEGGGDEKVTRKTTLALFFPYRL